MARLNLVFCDLIFFLESDEVVHLSLWFPLVRLSLLRSVRVVWQPLEGGGGEEVSVTHRYFPFYSVRS